MSMKSLISWWGHDKESERRRIVLIPIYNEEKRPKSRFQSCTLCRVEETHWPFQDTVHELLTSAVWWIQLTSSNYTDAARRRHTVPKIRAGPWNNPGIQLIIRAIIQTREGLTYRFHRLHILFVFEWYRGYVVHSMLNWSIWMPAPHRLIRPYILVLDGKFLRVQVHI